MQIQHIQLIWIYVHPAPARDQHNNLFMHSLLLSLPNQLTDFHS